MYTLGTNFTLTNCITNYKKFSRFLFLAIPAFVGRPILYISPHF